MVTDHPTYLQAKAQLDEAQRQLEHSVVRAPFNGVVTQVDQLQPGMYLVAATAALTNTGAVALVATDDVWIDANFKETDLTWVKPGEEVEISVDTYPGKTWAGKVKAISPASGSEFSILPAQNSSGNWVKVVQRIPVRIAVDRKEGDPPLRAGMSTYVTIDTRPSPVAVRSLVRAAHDGDFRTRHGRSFAQPDDGDGVRHGGDPDAGVGQHHRQRRACPTCRARCRRPPIRSRGC